MSKLSLQTQNSDGTPPDAHFTIAGPSTIYADACNQYVMHFGTYASDLSLRTAVQIGFVAAGNAKYFSDAGCTQAAASLKFDSGHSTLTFYYADTKPEAAPIVTTLDGAAGPKLDVVSLAGSASKFVWVAPPANAKAGDCTKLTLDIQDPFRNPVRSNTVALVSSSAGGSFFSDAACATSTTQLIFSAASEGFVYYRNTVAGNATFNVSDPTHAVVSASAQSIAIAALGPSKLLYSVSANPKTGDCINVSVIFADTFSNWVSNDIARTLAITALGSAALYSDAACTTSTTSVAVAAGALAGSTHFYLLDRKAETLSVHVAASGSPAVAAVNVPITISLRSLAGGSAVMALTGPTTAVAGVCTAFLVTAKDSQGNLVMVSSDVALTLGASAHGALYKNATCSTALSAPTITTGTGSLTFYLVDTNVETTTVSETVGTAPANTLDVVVGPNIPTSIGFTPPSDPVISTSTITNCLAFPVTVYDGYGNPSALPAAFSITLVYGGSGGTGKFFTTSDCSDDPTTTLTIPAHASASAFYFTDTKLEFPDVTIDYSAEALIALSPPQSGNLSGAVGSAMQPWAMRPGPGVVSAMFLPGSALPVRTPFCNGPYYVYSTTTQGGFAPVIADTPVPTHATGSFQYYADSACQTHLATPVLIAGTGVGTFFVSGDASATVGTLQIQDPQNVFPQGQFPQGAPFQAQAVTGAATIYRVAPQIAGVVQSESCVPGQMIQRVGGTGLPASGMAFKVTAIAAAPTTVDIFSDASCTTSITGTPISVSGASYNFYLKVHGTGLIGLQIVDLAGPPPPFFFFTLAK